MIRWLRRLFHREQASGYWYVVDRGYGPEQFWRNE